MLKVYIYYISQYGEKTVFLTDQQKSIDFYNELLKKTDGSQFHVKRGFIITTRNKFEEIFKEFTLSEYCINDTQEQILYKTMNYFYLLAKSFQINDKYETNL